MNSSSSAGTDFKTQVLGATDIVELIGQTVALKRAGRDYKGLCPFHQEKTPSFTVSPAKQFYYCYGCKEGGNAIDFVIKRDRVEFKDAIRTLAQKAGIEVPKFAGGVSKEKASERQVLLDAHSAACSFFEKSLSDPQLGAAARAYLEQRQINAESVKRFQIGLAIDAWDGLLRSPVGKKFPPPMLALGGLLKPRNTGEGYYDTFRNRLMFPIRDENGRVIAFGGRVMPGSEDPAKYLNSPETPLFSKGRNLFRLDLARQKIVETRTAIVVEGYTDVVVPHQFGVSNVVSPLGTAMTEQHVTILRRFADRIVLLFDADTAGDLAVDRAVGLFLTQPVEIAIASMPEGVDPDEYLIEHGTEAFERLISGATDALSYKWKQLSRRFNESGNSLTGQQKAIEEYLKLLAGARDSGPVDTLRWGQALSRVSRLTEIPREELNRRFGRSKKSAAPASQPSGSPTPRPVPSLKPEIRPEEPAERLLMGILLSEPRLWSKAQQRIGPWEFVTPMWRELAELYWTHQRDEGEPVFNEFLGLLKERQRAGTEANPDDRVTDLAELAIAAVSEADAIGNSETSLSQTIDALVELRRHREDQKLIGEFRRTSVEGSDTREQEEIDLLKQIADKARRTDLRRA